MQEKAPTPRKTVFIVAGILTAIALYAKFVKHSPLQFFTYMLVFAALVTIAAAVSRPFAALFEKWWMKLGHALGWVNSRIILTLIFFFILVPIAALRKLFRSKGEDMRSDRGSSMWHTCNHTFTPEDLTKQF